MKKLLFILTSIALVACGKSSQEQPAATETANTSTDTTAVAESPAPTTDSTKVDGVTSATALPNHTSYNGTLFISPQKHATVSLTMGGKVHSLALTPGTFVGRGAVIATLENPAFIELQRDYLDAHAQLSFLETEYYRQDRLRTEEAASQKRFQQSKADYLSMKSRLAAASAELTNLGVSPAAILKSGIKPYLPVHAPISGYVGSINVNLGKYLHEGDPICDLIDKISPMLCLTAYEKDLGDIAVGNRVLFRVNGMGEKTFNAVLTAISQEVDDTNRSIKIYAKIIGNNTRFRPGMYVTARVEKK